MRPYKSLWFLIDLYRSLCVLVGLLVSLFFMHPYVSLWVLKGPDECLRILMGPYGST